MRGILINPAEQFFKTSEPKKMLFQCSGFQCEKRHKLNKIVNKLVLRK